MAITRAHKKRTRGGFLKAHRPKRKHEKRDPRRRLKKPTASDQREPWADERGRKQLQAKTTTYMYGKAVRKESAQRSAWEADWTRGHI
jgi:hypothetical protein